MGYMGFGMRKEVYTRKPKKAFEKVRNLYKEEVLNRGSDSLNSVDTLKERVRARIKRDEIREAIAKVMRLGMVVACVSIIVWIVLTMDFTWTIKKYEEPSKLFRSKIYKQKNGLDLKIENYKGGPKAAETFF